MTREASTLPDVRAVCAALEAVAATRVVWPQGLLNPGGPHRRLRGMMSPISIGEDECLVFGRLVEALRPRHAFVIGNAFGFSGAYLARVMERCGGRRVVTLDNQTEGNGRRCAAVAEQLARRLDLHILVNKKGSSPEDVAGAVEAPVHQLVFIDGRHTDPQVTLDLEATLPFADRRTVFVWHDYWTPGVARATAAAADRGFSLLYLPTSCEMVVGTRDAGIYEALRETYPEGRAAAPSIGHGVRLRIVLGVVTRYVLDRLRGRG